MKHQMTVDFNNIRRQALHRYDGLVEKLNNAIIDEDGYISIHAGEIQEEMDDLRMLIGTMACCSYENDDEFKDVFSEVYPNEGDCMKLFNGEFYNKQY